MSTLQVGSKVGNYEIVKKLGDNPLGASLGSSFIGQQIVYDPTTGKPITTSFAIKTLNLSRAPELGIDPNTIQKQIELLKQISANPTSNRYISGYYADFVYTGEDGESYLIIVTDYIQGPTLQEIIVDQIEKDEPFDMNELLQKMFEIAQAVEYIHTYNVAHQNIKPSNIIFDNSDKRLKLVDFAFSCSQNLNTQCKDKAGTTYYMPPELIESPIDPSQQDFAFRLMHDIWSTGVVFYQMANLGKDYMDFASNDPEIIAKDILLQAVKPSTFSYVPINSVIETMLNKDYTKRPTSGQVVILLRLARPLCVVNGQLYDRQEAEALLTSLGLDIDPKTDDYTLCKALTDHLNICKINENEYQKEQLQQLVGILGIQVDDDINSVELCAIIQEGLLTQQEQYSDHVTQEILRALEYMSWIQIRAEGEPSKGESAGKLQAILQNLQDRYMWIYDEAKKLGLVNLSRLEARRKEITRKSIAYKQTASIAYATVYAILANKIVDVILDNDPDAEEGGLPLAQYKFLLS